MRTLTVIIPVYNEERHLRDVLPWILDAPCPIEREWLFVDDCSTDGSGKILDEFAAKFPLKVIHLPENRGKGAAIREAIKVATGDLIMIQDADFEYDPRDVPDLLAPLISGRADIVFGSRFKHTVVQVHRTYHYFVNRFLTLLSNLLSGLYLTDMETCYKIFHADFLKAMQLRSNRFGIEVELTAYMAKTAARVFELPIHYYPRTQLQGKKINWKDGIAALFHLVRFNWFTSEQEAFVNLPEHYRPGVIRPISTPPVNKE